VCPGHFTAREKVVVFIELEAGWALQLVWIFWRRDSYHAPAKILTPYLPAYILVSVLTVLHRADLKIIQKSVLIK